MPFGRPPTSVELSNPGRALDERKIADAFIEPIVCVIRIMGGSYGQVGSDAHGGGDGVRKGAAGTRPAQNSAAAAPSVSIHLSRSGREGLGRSLFINEQKRDRARYW